MPFLPPNQQRQSTEGQNNWRKKTSSEPSGHYRGADGGSRLVNMIFEITAFTAVGERILYEHSHAKTFA